jgi:transposase
MRPTPPQLPLRATTPQPWRRMTDREWAALAPMLRHAGPGRPAAAPRAVWDAIFWVACSTGPWRALPAELGRADTAHRTLRRAATDKRLHQLLVGVSSHRAMAGGPLHAIAWFIVRAFRRAFRVAPHAIAFARRLGLVSALPAAPADLPQPHLSETLAALVRLFEFHAPDVPLPVIRALQWCHGRIAGDPRRWRATA